MAPRAKVVDDDAAFDATAPARRVSIILRGDTALMFNRQLHVPAKDLSDEEVAKMKLHLTDKGKPCLPTANLIECWIAAGNNVQYRGMSNFTRGNPPMRKTKVTSFLSIEEEVLLIKPEKWEIDKRPFNAHQTTGAPKRPDEGSIRPIFPRGWTVTFTLAYETYDPNYTEAKARAIIALAGKSIGLGSYRITNGGYFGKYSIAQWKPLK